MKINHIKRICQRCNLKYRIPLLKQSKARENLLHYFPCTHCGYVFGLGKVVNNEIGLCTDCSVPFLISKHHAKGKCGRCYVNKLRKTLQNNGDIIRLGNE